MYFFLKMLLDQNLQNFGHGTQPALVQNAFAIRVTVNAVAVAGASHGISGEQRIVFNNLTAASPRKDVCWKRFVKM